MIALPLADSSVEFKYLTFVGIHLIWLRTLYTSQRVSDNNEQQAWLPNLLMLMIY